MKKVDLESTNVYIDVKTNDEIGELAKSFNAMITRIDKLIKNEYLLLLNQKEAHLKALQAQINPHFLYNILQSISSIATINKIDEISIIAKSLGRMFRYSIKTEGVFVSVEEETNHLIDYLEIEKIRYPNKFEYKIIMSPECEGLKILKLTLQPIVENSIIHGFKKLRNTDKYLIYIIFSKENDSLQIEISDNGIGIPKDILYEINKYICSGESGYFTEASQGIGIKNVYSRLRLYYEENLSFKIDSIKDVGTSIIFKFKV